MIQSLNKKWKELLYAFSGFGPNFLMVLMGAYFTDAVNPVALGASQTYQAIASGVCFILPAIFPILYALSKAFDGIIDIPFAHITDSLKTKWGSRRPPILACLIPMIISFAMCWYPVGGANNQVLNTVWILVWALIFFSTYTMCMIAFYGSLSTTCSDDGQKSRVSSYKSFFDTITYCLVYALVPLLLDLFKVHIDKFVFLSLPLMLTMAIPLFMIKEGEKYGYPEHRGEKPQRVTFKESLSLTFKNRTFMSWIIVNATAFFGLQMFLNGMNTMIIGGMGFNGAEMALINTCAFAPVPMMLYLFMKLKAKKGFRFTYQTCLFGFGIAILSFFFASTFMTGGNKMIQYIIACIGGVAGSWSIGAFFMGSYLVPAQISSVEERLTKKNHSAMYFAAQAVTTSVIGALSSLIYENIKMLFISKSTGGVVWAETITQAAEKFSDKAGATIAVENVFNLGTLLIPFIVFTMCFIGLILAFRMPKEFTYENIAKELMKHNPEITAEDIKEEPKKETQKGEILFVQIGLWVLSGGIFGFIWQIFTMISLKKLGLKNAILHGVLSMIIPFYSIVYLILTHNKLNELAKVKGVKQLKTKIPSIVLAFLFPIIPLNVLGLSFVQTNLNLLYDEEKEDEQTSTVVC